MTRIWSPYQTAIFDHIQNGEGNAIVHAVAGSGKTSTIVEGFKFAIADGAKAIFLAFNKAIADELKSRGVNARTFHSITYSAVTEAYGVRDIDFKKVLRIFKDVALPMNRFRYMKFVMRLVGLGKQMGIGCLLPDKPEEWDAIVTHHQLELDEGCNLEDALELASLVLEAHVKDRAVNFDDILYLPVRVGLSLPKFDFVFVDEAQDTNAIQRELLRKIMREDSRMVAVGDPSQSIYGFRGSDNNSMKVLKEEFKAKEFPLTISYRCPTSVVKYAQQWVPEIEAAPGAIEGVVKHLGKDWSLGMFQPGDLIVCRTTRHLVSLGFKLIRAQIPAHIMGKEIGEGLRALIKKMDTTNIDLLAKRITVWQERETIKALELDEPAKAEAIGDKAEAIISIIEGMPEDMRTLEKVYAVIDYLFAGNANTITLATIHKSKGLEAKRVFWLNRDQCPAKYAKRDWQKAQEINLCYVATTRAMEELYFLDEMRVIRDDVHGLEAMKKEPHDNAGKGVKPTGAMKPRLPDILPPDDHVHSIGYEENSEPPF